MEQKQKQKNDHNFASQKSATQEPTSREFNRQKYNSVDKSNLRESNLQKSNLQKANSQNNNLQTQGFGFTQESAFGEKYSQPFSNNQAYINEASTKNTKNLSFGQRLKQLRKFKNFTQTQLASGINVSHSTINRWEKNHRSPSAENIQNIAQILVIDPAELAFGHDNMDQHSTQHSNFSHNNGYFNNSNFYSSANHTAQNQSLSDKQNGFASSNNTATISTKGDAYNTRKTDRHIQNENVQNTRRDNYDPMNINQENPSAPNASNSNQLAANSYSQSGSSAAPADTTRRWSDVGVNQNNNLHSGVNALAGGNNFKQKRGEEINEMKYPPLSSSSSVIAFQGIEGAFSHLALTNIYPDANILPCETFIQAFEKVQSGVANLAILPIENSLGGRVADIHHLLPRSDLYIVGEYFHQIEHCLLAIKGSKLSHIKNVFSHEQALSQCRVNLHNMKLNPIKHTDTAAAARFVASDKNMHSAAIGSRLASKIYNLDILKENIEDKPNNITRFIILSKDAFTPPNSNSDVITSCLFYTNNIPSSLYKALGGFATNHINILKLESYVPMLTDSKNAYFYIEFLGALENQNTILALDELKFYTSNIKILGTYIKNRNI